MIEIKGKVNTAICYATVVEGEAIEQIRRMCDYDFTAGSQIRIMPDVHAGKGCTIGTTMTITDKAVPNIVGVDIGCGMYTAELGKVDVDFEKVDAAAHDIPSGRDVWEGRMERFDLTGLRCYRNLKQAKRLERSLGTLGGGNHFIEIDAASDGTKYLVIHSGSRNLGKQVAELYQSLAIDLNAGKADYFERRDELIRTYKEQGRRAEIQTALKAMEKEWAAKEPTIPADLCYLYGTYLEDYLHDVEICQQFARRSRERMAEIILEKTGMTALSSFHTIEDEVPFDIPGSWAWARISSICVINPKNDLNDDTEVSFISMPHICEGYENRHSFDIRKWSEIKTGYTYFAENDIGIVKITPCFENRKSVVFHNLKSGAGAGTTELFILRPIISVQPNYLLWIEKTDDFINGGVETFSAAVGQQRVDRDFIVNYLIPLPQ